MSSICIFRFSVSSLCYWYNTIYHSPALKKLGLYWICLVLLWFCHSVTFQMKIFVTLFSGTMRPRRLKLVTHVDSGQIYLVYQNQAAPAYSSFYFFIFLPLQFLNIEIFRHTFLRNCEACKVETWYTRGHVLCLLESGCTCILIPLFLHFSFSPIFEHWNFFVTLFLGTVRPRRLKLGTHMDSGQMYNVYQNQAASA